MYIIVRNRDYVSMFKMLKEVTFKTKHSYVVSKNDHSVKLALMDHGYFKSTELYLDMECYVKKEDN